MRKTLILSLKLINRNLILDIDTISEEDMVQQLVAGMTKWKTIIQSGIPCILILFWGAWSDRYAKIIYGNCNGVIKMGSAP